MSVAADCERYALAANLGRQELHAELERFCDAMISVLKEIREIEIEIGTADKQDNGLKNAPHTLERVIATAWTLGYTREQAAFPAEWIRGESSGRR